MAHFFVPEFTKYVQLLDKDVHHALRVLRLRRGELITVSDGSGSVRSAQIVDVTHSSVLAELTETPAFCPEPRTDYILLAAQFKSGKWESMLKKATELGVARVVPVTTQRSSGNPPAKNLPRLQEIAREAAMQSRRGKIPEVTQALSFSDAILLTAERRLFCYELEQHTSLRQIVSGQARSIALFTGPEGGFEPEEASQALQAGWIPMSLGPRILRCETAPIAALAALQLINGDMDPLET